MNFRANKLILAHMRKVWCFCFFGFTPALASKIGARDLNGIERQPAPPTEQMEAPHPYLSVVGPPPLRFQEPFALQKPATQPPALREEHAVGAPVQASSAPPAVGPAPAHPTQDAPPSKIGTSFAPGQTAGPEPANPTIIPDEMRRRVRPEEFLPFFEPPGSGAPNAAPSSNPPPTLPPSSATYRLE